MFKKAVVFKNVHTVSVMKHKLLTENSKKKCKHIFYNPDHNTVCMTFKNKVNKDVKHKRDSISMEDVMWLLCVLKIFLKPRNH